MVLLRMVWASSGVMVDGLVLGKSDESSRFIIKLGH